MPCLAQAVARGLRVGVLEGDERGVAARRDRAAVRLEPLGEPGGQRRAGGQHVGQPGAAQHAERGDAERHHLARERRRVVAARVGLERPTRARARRRRSQCSRARSRARARGTPARRRASRCRRRRTATSGRPRRRRRSRASRRRPGSRPAPCAPSRITGTPTSASASGASSPVCQLTCEQATSVVVGPDRVGELRERHRAHRHAALLGRQQRPEQAGVLVVGGDDLVARPEVHPGQDLAHPLAGRGGQRHVVDRAADQLGVAGAELVEQREPALEVRERAALLDLGGDLACGRLLRPRAGPARRCPR